MKELTATGTLLRLNLRRDRIKLPAWVIGLAFMAFYFSNAITLAYPSQEDLSAIVSFMQGPAGTIMTGPGYGLDDPSYSTVFAAVYGFYLLIGAAFMNVLLIVRHTRQEEETGRTEMTRSSVVGRHSPLAAAMLLALIANAALGILIAVAMSGTGYGASGVILFGASVASVGLVFAALTSIAVQAVEHARTATAIGSALIGAAVVIRGAGDVLEEQGSALSWFSPFAWAQQTRVFVDPRWWPLVLCLALAVLSVLVAYALESRRDVGAGFVAPRLGRNSATKRLSNPLALAMRLDRSNIIGWAVGLGIAGLLYGSLADSVQQSFTDLPENMVAVMGGDETQMLEGFLSIMVFFTSTLAACYAIVSVHRLSSEENSGRAEAILSTAVSRLTWVTSSLATALIGAFTLLVAAGFSMGLAVALVLGEARYVPELLVGHLAYLPAIAVIIALAGLGFALGPKYLNLAWFVAIYGIVMGYFGPLLDPPELFLQLSPFEHVARVPSDSLQAWPLVALALVALIVASGAVGLFRRRDMTTAA
ncbi:ABC transporter permease [Natronoglycomyces albus]|uniref:ABC transporter permease n=1 Tax=Natronoglycomyces albus TaxID=2811108 RepID=A0A895XN85_9ACTN|nr:hypothetical protein [Natronoglycomyces albus]QSB05242.1 hypothetical protein JQS30_16045 [Natronoglycomyces albus]